MKRLILTSLGALWGLQAFPISRVGTAKIGDEKIGFEASIPEGLSFGRKIIGGVQLNGLVNLALTQPGRGRWAPPIERSMVQIFDVTTDFEELSKLSRDSVIDVLGARGFSRDESHNPCVERFSKTNGSVETKFALWGPGRGVALALQPAVQSVSQTVNRLLNSVVLSEGSCRW